MLLHKDQVKAVTENYKGIIVSWTIWFKFVPLLVNHYMIILETCFSDILDSIVIHYGAGAEHIIKVTTIRAAMQASGVNYVTFHSVRHVLPDIKTLELRCTEFMSYGTYSSNFHNCIHFLYNILGYDISLRSYIGLSHL
jgi:hypothetical protein